MELTDLGCAVEYKENNGKLTRSFQLNHIRPHKNPFITTQFRFKLIMQKRLRFQSQNDDPELQKTDAVRDKEPTVIEKDTPLSTKETLETAAKEKLYQLKSSVERRVLITRMLWKSTLFVTALLYFFNFLFLYFGTIFETELAQPQKFFGFKEGQHKHLQRTNGVMWLLMSAVNVFALAKDENRGSTSTLLFSALCNAAISLHYALEMLYFGGMRLEVLAIQLFIVSINGYWTMVDYKHRRRVHELRGENPDLALKDYDEGLRSRIIRKLVLFKWKRGASPEQSQRSNLEQETIPSIKVESPMVSQATTNA